MTHPGILKINEFFNNKLSKNTDHIKIYLSYKANFANKPLFDIIRKILIEVGYKDISGQIDTLFCLIDSLQHNYLTDDKIKEITKNSKLRSSVESIIRAFKELIKLGKISFDSRVRRDIMMCIYLDSTNVNFKTTLLKINQQKILYEKFLNVLIKNQMIILRDVELKIDTADLYQQIYENAKSVITNMNSRGMSTFAIACYFWMNNRDYTPTPFLKNWSNTDFINAIKKTNLFDIQASDTIKNKLSTPRIYWSVLSETSLMTGNVANINPDRKEMNKLINQILNSEGEKYIKEYLKSLKLIQSSNEITDHVYADDSNPSGLFKNIELVIKNSLRERTTTIPSKEIIIEAIKYQFMISRVTDIDFSSKRKDHLILDKSTRQRIFEL